MAGMMIGGGIGAACGGDMPAIVPVRRWSRAGVFDKRAGFAALFGKAATALAVFDKSARVNITFGTGE